MEILQDMKKVFVSPSKVFEEQAEKQEWKKGVAITAIVFVIGMLTQMFVALMNPQVEAMLSNVENTGMLIIGGPIFLFIIGIIMLIFTLLGMGLGAGILHVSARICGGSGSYKSLYVCLLFLQAIGIVSVPVSLLNVVIASSGEMVALAAVIIFIGLLICFVIWSIYLYVVMLKKCYALSTKRAVLASFLPGIVFILFIMAIVIYLH